METIATHPGVVVHSADGHVQVKMEVISACGSCEAHAHCTFSEKKDKLVDIDTPHWKDYQPDDRVTVIINSSLTILVVCIYGWVLYLMRHRLQRKFTFRIEKQ